MSGVTAPDKVLTGYSVDTLDRGIGKSNSHRGAVDTMNDWSNNLASKRGECRITAILGYEWKLHRWPIEDRYWPNSR